MRIPRSLILGLACLSVPAQQVFLPQPLGADPAKLPGQIRELSLGMISTYQDKDRETQLSNLLNLRMASGDGWGDALGAIHDLRALQSAKEEPHANLAFLPYELFAQARLHEDKDASFGNALALAFRERFMGLDDRDAFQAARAFRSDLGSLHRDFLRTFETQKGRQHFSIADALTLIRSYEAWQIQEQLQPLIAPLISEDDQRRYTIQEGVLIKTRDGATVSAIIVRPKAAKGPLPTAFGFTIYADDFNLFEAKHSAANGFAGVVANTRGKRISASGTVPYEHDGADADDVIEWIARQPWSDGQVGMYGGSYDGFTQWAAAKHPPKALKSIMPSVAAAPGIDVPMEGGIFKNFTYKWIPYVTDTKGLDEAGYNDFQHWNNLDWTWFSGGKPYRDLEKLDGKPNPIFDRWLDHPTYDAYWQAMIPYGDDFSRIRIPVLTTTGYYDGGEIGALYYFQEHVRHDPAAEHYVVIGPYDHIGAQRRSADELLGYKLDPAAKIDIEDLRYQWLDYTLRGGRKPSRLKGRINYEVMGANAWKQADAIAAASDSALKLYLDPVKAGDAFRLSPARPSADTSLRLEVDMADRDTLSFGQPVLILDKSLDSDNGFAFKSAPLKAPLEVSGLFSGTLDFITNKKDMDLNVAIYEQTPQGEYLFLSYFMGRLSYVQDRAKRHLLIPGKPQTISFRSGRMTSRRMEAGSRVVLVVSINKQPRMQVNYGSGKDVSDESMADAKTPLEVTWLPGSSITLPIWK